jgi:hypothetical protein
MDYAFGEQAYETIIETIQKTFTECGIGFYMGKAEFLKVEKEIL